MHAHDLFDEPRPVSPVSTALRRHILLLSTSHGHTLCPSTFVQRPNSCDGRPQPLQTPTPTNMAHCTRVLLQIVVASAAASVATAAIPVAAQTFVDRLGLARTNFGTYLKVTWTSEFITPDLPVQFEGGTRPLQSSIIQVYTRDDDPKAGKDQAGFPLHLLESDEQWHWYSGDGDIELFLFDLPAATITTVHLGVATAASVPQFVVPQQTWIGALLPDAASWALTGAANIPAFDPRDSHMAADNSTLAGMFRKVFAANLTLVDRLLAF